MGGFEWQIEETAVAVFFASAGVHDRTILQLLAQRGFSRTMVAIRNKVAEVRIHQNLGTSRHWDIAAVDLWLDRIPQEYNVDTILRPTEVDQNIVSQVRKVTLEVETS
jgi:hypothetical protein